MPPPGLQLYFIAIIPPSPIREEIQGIKEYVRDRYKSKAALKSPPHITLHMPFQWKEVKEERLISTLGDFVTSKVSFRLSLENFSCFAPKVIYIDVLNSESLSALQRDLQKYCKTNLNLFNAQYRDLPFHPHLTIAFRDLKKDEFVTAWEEFEERKYSASFTVDKITLLKQIQNKWEIYRDFEF